MVAGMSGPGSHRMGTKQFGTSWIKSRRRISAEKARQKKLAEETRKLQVEVRKLRRETIAVARQMQEREGLISTLENQLVELRDEQTARKASLKQQRLQLSDTLGAFSRMPAAPEKLFFLYPGDPEQAVRSAMLLKEAVPALRDRADSLRDELHALAAVEQDIASKLKELTQAEDSLGLERARMTSLLAQKKALVDKARVKEEKSRKRISKLVSEAKSLKDLINKLNKARPKARPAPENPEQPAADDEGRIAVMERPDTVRPFPAKGPVTAPVVGRLVQKYGQDLGFGQTAKGLRVQTRAKAQIVAPHDGQIVFSGPFRDHGLILIIEHPGGYHTVLAGFETVDVITGQWLVSGEPVGSMGARSANKGPELYVELRRDGRPVNPLNWFSAGNIKVHG